ncbi:MAG TPA: TetR/AcrR family transcriptional regulator [Flavobacteriaceae bacterium]|nr:TetR/AcrR family transcriptional regulator [Flavobacteriaceae bacterium]
MSKEDVKKDDTYKLILETAKSLFFAEGKFNATTQEIADAAGVNRTLINYYFRSRNALIDLVFKEAMAEEEKQQKIIVMSSLPLREKLEKFIDFSFQTAKEYPYMEMYMVTHMNQQNIHEFKTREQVELLPFVFENIQAEMDKGNIEPMEPIQFLLNFISLVSFPISMRLLLQKGLNISDAEFERILDDRKNVILKTLFKN